MKIQIPILHQEIVNNTIVSTETQLEVNLDTSVYSEERWEQNFPLMAQKEGLFQYIERIHKAHQDPNADHRVSVISMLKAIYCFLDFEVPMDYKSFCKLFNLAQAEYATKLINSLKNAFQLILGSSSVKNL